jgi:hypothetical protein
MRLSRFRSAEGRGRLTGLCGVLVVVAIAVGLAGCSGGSGAQTVARPHTDARLQIVSPAANATTGPSVTIVFAVEGAKVSLPNKLKLASNEGHIHVSLDGKLVAMSYGLSTTVNGLTPGAHTLQAEFVANDHLPFANRVIAAEIFTVQ